MVSLCTSLFASSFLFHFHLSKSLRLESNLILHFVFLLDSKQVLSLSLFVLLFYHFGLFCLFFLLKQQSILNFLFLFVSLLRNHVVILRHMPFLLVLKLNVEDFLNVKIVVSKQFNKLTFWTFSSFLFLRFVISPVLFLVSSIFFQVFISSCLRRAIRFARSWASRSMLKFEKWKWEISKTKVLTPFFFSWLQQDSFINQWMLVVQLG